MKYRATVANNPPPELPGRTFIAKMRLTYEERWRMQKNVNLSGNIWRRLNLVRCK